MRYLLLLFVPLFVLASSVKTPLLSVEDDLATIKSDRLQPGVSGYVIRHFDPDHSAIIARLTVISYDETEQTSTLRFTPYDGLLQESLPTGTWQPKAGDIALLADDYSQVLLIAPDKRTYEAVKAGNTSVKWVHPDLFAAHLSIEGHPTPLKEDFQNFCTQTSTGLLYIFAEQSLFTMDCKNMALLDVQIMPLEPSETQLPFYSRVQTINADLWGEGSSELEEYAPYYLELINTNNQGNAILQSFLKTHGDTMHEE